MAIASLVLFSLAAGLSILHTGQIDIERFSGIIALVASISGLILGIWSIRSNKRRRMGIVGTVLNSIAVPGTSFFLVLIYYFGNIPAINT